MGLFDRLKRKDAADTSISTFAVTTRDASVDMRDPQKREALEQAERLIHEILTGGAEQGSAGGTDERSAGEDAAGAFVFAAPTQVIVAGETVSPEDPRALEAVSTAAAKLREHGLDELAAELEARVGATAAPAPAAAPAAPPPAFPPAGEGAQPLLASAGDAIDTTPSAADTVDTTQSAPPDDLDEAPDAPAPPEPPAPPF
jgi:hypothetical protein